MPRLGKYICIIYGRAVALKLINHRIKIKVKLSFVY